MLFLAKPLENQESKGILEYSAFLTLVGLVGLLLLFLFWWSCVVLYKCKLITTYSHLQKNVDGDFFVINYHIVLKLKNNKFD